jgi:hypothetical protein
VAEEERMARGKNAAVERRSGAVAAHERRSGGNERRRWRGRG